MVFIDLKIKIQVRFPRENTFQLWKSIFIRIKCFWKKSQISAKSDDLGFKRTTLRKGLSEVKGKTEMYILEGDDDFEKLSPRTSVSCLSRVGNNCFREWIVDKGMKSEIPNNWINQKHGD